MTPEVFARVRPFVSVRSGQLAPDPTFASSRMLAMKFPTDVPDQQRLRYLRVRVSVHTPGAPRSFTREASLMLERRIAGGALLKTWERSLDPVAEPGDILSDIGPCLTSLDPAKPRRPRQCPERKRPALLSGPSSFWTEATRSLPGLRHQRAGGILVAARKFKFQKSRSARSDRRVLCSPGR